MKSKVAEQHKTMLRLDKALHAKLMKAAEEEGRTVNQQIAFYIRKALEAREKDQAS